MADTKMEMTPEEQVFSFVIEDLYVIGSVGIIAAGTVQTGAINTEQEYTLRVARSHRLIKAKDLILRRRPGDPIISAPNGGGICLDIRRSDHAVVKGDVLTVVSKP